MQSLQLIYQGLSASSELGAAARQLLPRLEPLCSRGGFCSVKLERWQQHRQRDASYRVVVELCVPGERLVVAREAAAGASPEALRGALRQAFDATELDLKRALSEAQDAHARQLSAEARRLHLLHGRATEDESPELHQLLDAR